MIFKYASTLILLLPSLALNSRIRDPSTLCLLNALKYSARDNNIINFSLKSLGKDVKHNNNAALLLSAKVDFFNLVLNILLAEYKL